MISNGRKERVGTGCNPIFQHGSIGLGLTGGGHTEEKSTVISSHSHQP